MFSTKSLVSALLGIAALGAAANGFAGEPERPAVIRALERQGLSHVQELGKVSGLRGYAGMAGQQPITIYVADDGNAIVGSRISPEGENLDEARVQELVAKPMGEAIWKQLDESTWVADGKARAPRVVYAFSDPNCPYCNRFWEAARPWVDAGKVQLRHIIVGVIRADSSTKAAAILGAPDRSAALLENERHFRQGGIKPAASVPAAIRDSLDNNQILMAELGFRGTPGILYKDEQGRVQRVNGMPRPEALERVLGPR
ncbi:dihydroneopterin aldolase [Bordetella pseudohinzii]|uniref:Thiol:disulfide interchange protein n=1 Tax=Bordetella pseudohinzii TaxID=1331258 RepID=A0A0J6C3F7_9BORD|nr:thiol:disulfide interchange protein DsbG [Bordetella pseudohinzii]ANY17387.1 thiol:disulfide interchange protein DsbG [Bordetella pseudohinzii]KMM25603.1 dihydroneopterin aldolase [Bordetella pseudohinzii]KXA81603.1 dihydroneopterin aldolase [Bordetella pseudohinzii]KXA83156.1 dihydroneopterin aldolase [Bordetella pseudohinzii]CUI70133.1 Thiol:disulfide interchange protein DsbG precursor [Bordetella pseudohinzii]